MTCTADVAAPTDAASHLTQVQFWEGGYLFLATKEREAILKRNTALQCELGSSIQLMSAPPLIFQPLLCFICRVQVARRHAAQVPVAQGR